MRGKLTKAQLAIVIATIPAAGAIAVAAIKTTASFVHRSDRRQPEVEMRNFPLSTSGNAISASGIVAGRDANINIHADHRPLLGTAKISDVFIRQNKAPNKGLFVDLRVVNIGEQPVSISRVRFAACSTPGTIDILPYSGHYKVDASILQATGESVEVIVAQQIRPGETDRFSVELDTVSPLSCNGLQPILVTSNGDVVGPVTAIGVHSDPDEDNLIGRRQISSYEIK